MILQQPPPFEPTEFEAVAITNMGYMFAEILVIMFFMILMIYLYRKMKRETLPILIVFLFSLLVGLEGLTHFHTYFSPYFEIFFLLFQASIFALSVLEYYNYKKGV